MSEYERSPRSSHRGYKPRDRTTDWVSRLPPKQVAHFVDPGMPPSDTESAVYSSDSDAESSRSVPPRFVLRFPDGREERVSEGYYSNGSSRRSRAASGPVNHYGPPPPHHHPRSMSLQMNGGYPVTPGYIPRPHSSNTNIRPQEQIRILPTRSAAPGTPGYGNSRTYGRDGHQDDFVLKHGPPEPIKFSNSHPSSKFDPPTRDYSASGYRPHQSSKLRPSVIGSPASHVSQLTKENTIANSHTRTLSRGGVIEDNWSVIDEDEEEWAREQQRAAAYRRGRTYSSSSGSPPLSFSRSRTTSSSSRSGFYPPAPKFSAPEKMGPPPAHSTGASSRSFFSRLFRVGSDKHLPISQPPPPPLSHHSRLHRRHSTGGSRR